MDKKTLTDELQTYVGQRFIDEDSRAELTPTTPLLEWGILTSMNTAILLTHIRENYGVHVPPQEVTGRNLASIDSLAELLTRLLRADEKQVETA